jgi:hypothetical protein
MKIVFAALLLFLSASAQIRDSSGPPTPEAPQRQTDGYYVRCEVAGPDRHPVRGGFVELRLLGDGEPTARSPISLTGSTTIPSIQPGQYDLSFEAGGFLTVSRTIKIDGDKDLGRIVLDVDPDVLYASSGALLVRTDTEHRQVPSPLPRSLSEYSEFTRFEYKLLRFRLRGPQHAAPKMISRTGS